jgi:hypothetical protein
MQINIWMRNMVADIEGKRSLKVFENRLLRKIFGLKRDEAPGD